jgi:hypothetical protein
VLPFASVSCGGHEVFTARGFNAAVGGQYTFNGRVNYYTGDPYFLTALFGAILALAGQLLRPYVRVRLIASAVAGLGSVVMMLIGQAHENSRIVGLQTNGAVTIRWEIGYWIALFAIAAGTLVAGLLSYRIGVGSVPDRTAHPTTTSAAVIAGGTIAMVAALLIIAACAIPYIHYTSSVGNPFDPTSSPSVLIPGFGAESWFAAEPVAVAILAFVAGVVLVESTSPIARAIAAGALVAYGVQTFLLFVGYVALAKGSPDAQLQPGGVVGMLAGVLLFASGLAALNPSRRTPQQAIALVRSWVPRRPPVE